MNVANRMESNSAAGCVNCSLAAALLLAQQDPEVAHRLEPRGEVVVKGKGHMEMFFLHRQRQPRGDAVVARLRKLGKGVLVATAVVAPENDTGGGGFKHAV